MVRMVSNSVKNSYNYCGFISSVSQPSSELLQRIGKVEEPLGDYKLCYPRASVYFEGLIGYPFVERDSDQIDKWIFDILIAVEDGDSELLGERVIALDTGDPQNRQILLTSALLLAEEMGDVDKQAILRTALRKMSAEMLPCSQLDKTREQDWPLLAARRAEEEQWKTDEESSGNSSTVMKTVLIGTLVLGSLIGINYLFNSGMPVVPSPDSAKSLGDTTGELLDSTGTPIPLCDQPGRWGEYENQITKAINSCSATREFGERAAQASLSAGRKAWRIKIVPRDSQLADGAAAYYHASEVRIKCDASEPVSTAAFELTNFIHQDRFDKLLTQSCWGQIKDRNEYARIAERVEYDGTQMHVSAMEQCRQEKGWGRGVSKWYKFDFETYWFWVNHTRSDGISHAEFHRQSWDRTVLTQYVRKPIATVIDLFKSLFVSS